MSYGGAVAGRVESVGGGGRGELGADREKAMCANGLQHQLTHTDSRLFVPFSLLLLPLLTACL